MVPFLGSEGDADLFVSGPQTPFPSRGNYDWTSASDYTEIVTVPANVCPPPCMFYIGVMAYQQINSSYLIMAANSSAPTPLTPGVPASGFVATNDVDRYLATYSPITSADTFQIALSTLNGDPDIYVLLKAGPGDVATAANADYVALGTDGTELVVIDPSDPIFTAKCQVGKDCGVAISVFGFVGGEYRLVVNVGGGTVDLLDGVPVQAYVAASNFAYFKYVVAHAADVTITVTTQSGDPDLFVSALTPTPSAFNNSWSSATGNGQDEIVVMHPADAGYPAAAPFTVYIGVWAYGFVNATFIVTAKISTGNTTTTPLLDGIPAAGIAAPHSFAYYSFRLSAAVGGAQGVDFVVTPRTGEGGGGSGVLGGKRRGRNDLWLAVLSVVSTAMRQHQRELHKIIHIHHQLFSLSPLAGDIDLYVSNLTTPSGAPIYPAVNCSRYLPGGSRCLAWTVDPKTYTWSSALSSTNDVVSLPLSAVYAGENFTVGVLATSIDLFPSGAAPPPSTFDVIATTSGTTTMLQAGLTLPGVVSAGAYKYYRFEMKETNTDLMFVAQPTVGEWGEEGAEQTT